MSLAKAVPSREKDQRTPVKRLFLRFLLALGLLLVLLYPLYLAAGNHFLRSGELERRLNRRPERFLLRFEEARTVFPGVIQFKGLQVRNQTRTVQWWLAIDSGSVEIDLLRLYGREFVTHRLSGQGVAFRLRRRADTPARKTVTRRELEPAIPGFTNPPRPAPEALYPPGPPRRGGPQGGKRREPWRLHFGGVELDGVREIWIEEVRFAGLARAAGSFDLHLRRRFELEGVRLDVARGDLSLGAGRGEPILAGVKGRVAGNIASYRPADYRGWKMLRFVSGRAEIDGRVPRLDWLDLYLRKTRWVELRGAAGPLDADLRMKNGRFVAGSHLESRPESLTVGFLDYQAEGSGTARWELNPQEGDGQDQDGQDGKRGEAVGRIALKLDDFRLKRRGAPGAHVRGRDLRLDAGGSHPPRLAAHDLFTPQWVALEMPRAEVPDLSFYNAYLPEKVNLSLTGGSGVMSGSFRAAAPDWDGSGELRLRGRGISARFEDRRLRGDLAMHTLLRKVDFKDRRFDISGTKVDLENVRLLGAPTGETAGQAWWARAHLDHAVIEPGAPVYFRTAIESTLSDPRPLMFLFVPERRKRVLRWVDDLLDVQGLGATAQVEVGQRSVLVDELAVVGGKAQLLGRLRLGGEDKSGVLYASYGSLDVGLELQGTERDWKILRPKKWFAEQRVFD